MINAVIFDCYGVLVLPGRTGLYRDFPELEDKIKEIEIKSDIGELNQRQFCTAFSMLTGLDEETIKAKYYDTNYCDYKAINWALSIKANYGVKIGMLSNVGKGWLYDFLKEMDKFDLFDEVVLSNEVGIIKPNPEIFKIMADRLNLRTNQCVMIDDIQANIIGAKQAGMSGIVYKSVDDANNELEKYLK